MIAPSGGSSPLGSSGGMGVSLFVFQRIRSAVCGAKRWTSRPTSASVTSRSGWMSSRIQNPRPCVATTRSSPLTTRSRIDVTGMFRRSGCQSSPSLKLT